MQAGIAYLMSSLFISGNKSRRTNEPKTGRHEQKTSAVRSLFAATHVKKNVAPDEGEEKHD